MKKILKYLSIFSVCFFLFGCNSTELYRAYIQANKDYLQAYQDSPRTELNFRADGTLETIAVRDPMQRTMLPATTGQKLLDYALPLGLGLGSMYFTYLNNKEAFSFASGAFNFGSNISAQSFANEPFIVQGG